MSEPEAAEAARTLKIPITRDPGFVRLTADQAVCTNLGHDMELTLLLLNLQVDLQSVSFDGDEPSEKQVRIRRELVEVARVRTSPGSAWEIAMAIIQRLLESDFFEEGQLMGEIEGLLAFNGAREGSGEVPDS